MNCITNLSYRQILKELSTMTLRCFIKLHYSNYDETHGILEQKGINPRMLKSRIAPEDLKQFELLNISKNKISCLFNVSVSTLKRIKRSGGLSISPEEWAEERDYLQQCINRLKVLGYTHQEIAFIFCSSTETLKKRFDLSTEFPVVNAKSNPEKRMLRKAYLTGNIYNELFTDDEGGVIV